MSTANQQVQRSAAAVPQKKDVRELLQSEAVLSQLRKVLPKYLTAERMARVMLTACIKTPKLLQCTRESLLQAMMICSQAGLEPDGRNAHLIPYGDTVQVIFDYKGLVALAERNGVKNIYADKVCDNDKFRAWVEDGVKKLNHEIDFTKPRGNAYAYYSSCRRSDMLDYEVMTKDEVDAIRKRSKAAGNGPWVTDYDEMAKKTVLRRMSKRWDLSSEVAEVINDDDDVPTDINKAKRPAFGDDPFSALPEAQVTSDAAVGTVKHPVKTSENLPQGEKTPPVSQNVAQPPIGATEPGKPDPTSNKENDDGDLGPANTAAPAKEADKTPPAPEPQNVEVPTEAVAVALEIVSFRKIEGETDDGAYMRLTNLMKSLFEKSGVSEANVLKYARANDNQKSISDLAASKLIMIAKSWSTILPEVRKETA
jgi:recombination protein RecT